jgi:Domain of unknown function (DUF1858)
MEQETKLNGDSIIGDVVENCPAAKPVIEKYFGTTCFTCPGMKTESLSFGAMMHNVDVNEVLRELNEKCGR